MSTLTQNDQHQHGMCPHKLATSCRLTARPICCACQDRRPHAAAYRKYVDGIGYVFSGTRQDGYCWPCKEFWDVRTRMANVSPRDARIPYNPDVTAFCNAWHDWHRGYRIIGRTDGHTERIELNGTPLDRVDIGQLPTPTNDQPAIDPRAIQYLPELEIPAGLLPEPQVMVPVAEEDRLFDDETSSQTITQTSEVNNQHHQNSSSISATDEVVDEMTAHDIQAFSQYFHTIQQTMGSLSPAQTTVQNWLMENSDHPGPIQMTRRLVEDINQAFETLTGRSIGGARRIELLAALNRLPPTVEATVEVRRVGFRAVIDRLRFRGMPPNPAAVETIQDEDEYQTATEASSRTQRQSNTHNGFRARNRRPELYLDVADVAEEINRGDGLHVILRRRQPRPRPPGERRVNTVNHASARSEIPPAVDRARQVFGTREEVQHPDYQSPINLMFDRAERYGNSAAARRAQRQHEQRERENAQREIVRLINADSTLPPGLFLDRLLPNTTQDLPTLGRLSGHISLNDTGIYTHAFSSSPALLSPPYRFLDILASLRILVLARLRVVAPLSSTRSPLQYEIALWRITAHFSEYVSDIFERRTLPAEVNATCARAVYNDLLSIHPRREHENDVQYFARISGHTLPEWSADQYSQVIFEEATSISGATTAATAAGTIETQAPVAANHESDFRVRGETRRPSVPFTLGLTQEPRDRVVTSNPFHLRRSSYSAISIDTVASSREEVTMNRQWAEPRTTTHGLPTYMREAAPHTSIRHLGETDAAYHERLRANLLRQQQEQNGRHAPRPSWMDEQILPPAWATPTPRLPAMTSAGRSAATNVTRSTPRAPTLAPAAGPLENHQMQVNMACTICREQIADIALAPCGHLVMCRWCSETHAATQNARTGSTCPLCRTRIKSRLRIWGLDGGGGNGNGQRIVNDSSESSADEAARS